MGKKQPNTSIIKLLHFNALNCTVVSFMAQEVTELTTEFDL